MEQYIVSARKYRPATFDMVVGQRALTTTLLNAIRTGKLAHAYLFCGPRGVGKTTCARIFAKTITCEHLGENGEPCGECESCRAFDEGRSMNIHELDAASNNSVDDIRELIDQVRIPPQVGRYKVFIIDEVHMLSQQAFNAFLKTLEEPPKYVIFILATTEKHKILPTILSRCQVYDFARITLKSTVDHLKYVAEKEGYTVEEEALNLIAQKADGGMRDALSIFDQMVSFTQGNVTYQATLENLNILDSEYYFRMVDLLLAKNVEESLLLYNEIVEKGFDGGNFIGGLASHFRSLLVSRDAKTLPLLEVSEAQQQRFHEQTMRCRPQFLYRAIRLCNDCDLGYRQSRNKRLQVELCLIQVAEATDDDGAGAGRRPAKILKPLFKQTVAQVAAASAPAAPQMAANVVAPRQATAAKKAPEPQKLATLNLASTSIRIPSARPQQSPASQPTSPQAAPTASTVTTSTPSATAPKVLDTERLILAWQQFANTLPQSEAVTAQRLRAITPEVTSPTSFSITVSNPFIQKAIEKIGKDIRAYIGQELQVPGVSMDIKLAAIDVAVKSYSKPDLFQKMLKDSVALKQLHQIFELEIE
ncbi:MAG: DNA polymerase III subunit gamma/tau [Bacteroidaceae bacterium]|nr:DNA polymerase III subunit gamma/tau [Bacteroidaceae bacterium]